MSLRKPRRMPFASSHLRHRSDEHSAGWSELLSYLRCHDCFFLKLFSAALSKRRKHVWEKRCHLLETGRNQEPGTQCEWDKRMLDLLRQVGKTLCLGSICISNTVLHTEYGVTSINFCSTGIEQGCVCAWLWDFGRPIYSSLYFNPWTAKYR